MRIKLQIPFTTEELCSILDTKNTASGFQKIEYITTDSRICYKGDAFIALSGERYDGRDFCRDAAAKGALCISDTEGDSTLLVENTRRALLKIARAYKNKLPKLKYTVGITGSVGKSTTKEFLREILKSRYTVHATEGNYNNHIGVPITVLSADKDTEVLVLEMGMNAKGEISELSRCVNPDIGIITSIGTAHIGRLNNRAGIVSAKLEILDGMRGGKLLVPYAEPLLSDVTADRVGINTSMADVCLNISSTEKDTTRGSIMAYGDSFNFTVGVCGEHLMSDLAFAICASLNLNLSKKEITFGINRISANNIRQKVLEYKNFTIIDDSYNASLESLTAAFVGFEKYKDRVRSALLSDVLELGVHADSIHYEIGVSAARCGFDKLYLFGEFAERIKEGAVDSGMREGNIIIKSDAENICEYTGRVFEKIEMREVILAKASHATDMKTVLKMLDERSGDKNA